MGVKLHFFCNQAHKITIFLYYSDKKTTLLDIALRWGTWHAPNHVACQVELLQEHYGFSVYFEYIWRHLNH